MLRGHVYLVVPTFEFDLFVEELGDPPKMSPEREKVLTELLEVLPQL